MMMYMKGVLLCGNPLKRKFINKHFFILLKVDINKYSDNHRCVLFETDS